MPKTETPISQLKVNELTKTQFESASDLSETELYAVDPEFTGGKLLKTDNDGNIVESTLSESTVGTVTSVNNVQPVNGNVSLTIPTQASDISALDTDASNITSTGKETIVGWGAIDYDSGVTVSSSPYVPSKDGLFVLQSDGSDDMTISVNGNVIQHVYYSQIIDLRFSVPVGKGDTVTYVARGRGTQAAFFYPVKGE